jgi:hypothetical protein
VELGSNPSALGRLDSSSLDGDGAFIASVWAGDSSLSNDNPGGERQGSQGAPGRQGAQGVRGVQGTSGPSGGQGVEGPPGETMSGAQGTPGERGRQGRNAPMRWAPLLGYLILSIAIAVLFAVIVQDSHQTCVERNRTESLVRETFLKMAELEEDEAMFPVPTQGAREFRLARAKLFRERANAVGELPKCTRLGR